MPADMQDNQNPKITQDKSAVGTTPPTPNPVKASDTTTNVPPKSDDVPVAPVADDANLETAQALAKEKAEPMKPGEKPKTEDATIIASKPTPTPIPPITPKVANKEENPEPVKPKPLLPPTPPAHEAKEQGEKPLGLATPTAIPLKDNKVAMSAGPGSIPPKPPIAPTSSKSTPSLAGKPKTPGKGKKIIMAFIGFLLLLGGVVAGYYYYNAQTPQIAAVKDLSRDDCENYGCWDDRYSLYWDRDENACKKKVDSSCGSDGSPLPGTCEANGGECRNVSNCLEVEQANMSGNCNTGVCCTESNSEGGTGGGTGYDGEYCNSSGCNTGGSYPTCYVTHYSCEQSGVGNCTQNVESTRVQSASFIKSCGTEQIDVLCNINEYWRCSSSGLDYKDEGLCNDHCGGSCTRLSGGNNSLVYGGSSSKSYGADCTTETHSVCNNNNQCVERDGAGTDQCSNNSDCATETHSVCNENDQCVERDGAGSDECSNNSDCADEETHSVCNENDQCVEVDGAGTDQCSEDGECVETEILACLSISQDLATPALGDDVDFVCAGSHSGGADLTYQFRYSVDGGTFTSSTAIANVTTINIDQVGVWEVQCRVCGSVNGSALCSSVWAGADASSCTDTDGGKEYFLKGTASLTNEDDGIELSWTDFCDDIEGDGILNEYYCNNDSLVNDESYQCPNGCLNGACI